MRHGRHICIGVQPKLGLAVSLSACNFKGDLMQLWSANGISNLLQGDWSKKNSMLTPSETRVRVLVLRRYLSAQTRSSAGSLPD